MSIVKMMFSIVFITLCLSSITVRAQSVLVNWSFDGNDTSQFTLSSLHAATAATDDPTVAGDEALTGGWDTADPNNLPQAGVAWTVGTPKDFNGLKPGADPGSARIDSNGVLDYDLGKARVGFLNTGSLNTYDLNMHGDHVHADTNDQIATSPKVVIGSNMYLSALSWGGGPGDAPEFDTVKSEGYKTGSMGIAVLLASNPDSILASMGCANHGSEGVDTLNLSAFAGDTVVLQVVDAYEGGWGWIAFDEIQIGTEILQLPATANPVAWNFDGNDASQFTLSSLHAATAATDDPTVAGDEALTGGWDTADPNNLPQAGVAWVVGAPKDFNGLKPGADPGSARIDSNGALDYSLGKARVGYINTGSLNTYDLNMHGDHVHADTNDQIATSPKFLVGEKYWLSALSWGGGPGDAPEFDTVKSEGYKTGSMGIAVLLASNDSIIASVGCANHGSEGLNKLDLSAFAGMEVKLQVVDAYEGGWGWIAFDAIQVGPDTLSVPAGASSVTWNFDGNDASQFNLSSLHAATPAAEDDSVAGDEALTGGWEPANPDNLPQAGVVWVVGSPSMYNGLKPGADPGSARIDANGLMDYSLGKARIGDDTTGSLNTYLLNMHGDHVHADTNDQIATSPNILLGDNFWLSALSWGGGPGNAPEFDSVKTQGYKTGSMGIAVLLASNDSIIASMGCANHGTEGVNKLDLSAFGGMEVKLQAVDAYEGGWGWIAFDAIQVGPDTLTVPVVSGVENANVANPMTYELMQNYPNPFNPTTTIQFQIPKEGNVKVAVYNILGQLVKTLTDENMKAGIHKVTFNAVNFASGVYFYRISVNDFSQVKKMMLIK